MSFAEMLQRIGGFHAFRQLTVLPILVLLSFGTAFADPERGTTDSPGMWVAVAAIAGAGAWLFFTLCEVAIIVLPNASARARGAVALVVYAVTEATRAALVAELAVVFGVADQANWPFRLVAGAMTGLALFSMWAVILNDGWSYRQQLRELTLTQAELRRALETRQVDIERRLQELVGSVRSAISEALKAVAQRDPASPDSARRTAAELVRISDDVVRPMAHRLYSELDAADAIEREPAPRLTLRAVLQYTPVTRPFRPEAAVALGFLLMFGRAVFGATVPNALWFFLAGLAVVYLYLAGARWLVLPLMRRMKTLGRWLVFLGVTLAFVWAIGGTVATTALPGPATDLPLKFVYVTIVGLAVMLLLAVPAGLNRARDEVIAERAQLTRRLEWMNARLNAQLWANQKLVARTLHRDVQGVLVAASLRLEQALRAGADPDEAEAEVRELIEMASNFVVSKQPEPLLETTFAELRSTWEHVLQIDDDLSAEVRSLIDSDPIARQSVAELVGEFAVDSVKHGRSTWMSVAASLASEDTIAITLRNDGMPLPEGSQSAGVGSHILASNVLRFVRSNLHPRGVQVEALLPIRVDG